MRPFSYLCGMKVIDTHAHLYSQHFTQDLPEVIKRAREVLAAVMLPNIDRESIPEMHRLAAMAPDFFFPMMGLHPSHVQAGFEAELEMMEGWLEGDEVTYFGIGETGIDLYWDKTTLDIQRRSLQVHIDWAKAYDLPIILHARNAIDEVADLIEHNLDDRLRGIFHCFDGSPAQAARIAGFGSFKLGIGGIATYRKDVQAMVRDLDPGLIVLETDSPYLPPEPRRKDKPRRNESSYTRYVAEAVARLKDMTYEEVAALTNANAREIFRLS
ncbi:MAG: TatD family deoxyribonuclease [Bacteroidetes bacterium]|nr:MAG: TatD family deoxyribonuclease [Bacteroidota bacterium]